MDTQSRNSNPGRKDASWHVWGMVSRGTFGTGKPAEQRLIVRSNVIRGFMLVWELVLVLLHKQKNPTFRSATLLLLATLCTYYALEKRKYFVSLDELTQRIELEGMAWRYSLGVLAALWAGGVGYAISIHWQLNPNLFAWTPFFLFAVLMATVKGSYRYFAARRY